MITGMRQGTRRVRRYCFKESEEYGVIYGEPTAADLARGHNARIGRDMDAHEKICEKNPNRKRWWEFWR